MRSRPVQAVINGNTQEYVVDQYISMVLEKTLAGPNPRDERFPNMMPSSETQAFWLFPGTAPTLTVGARNYGQLVPAAECKNVSTTPAKSSKSRKQRVSS
jgi:hypothetical protein